MSENNEEKGLRKLSTFITANALLAAVLLVWAQIWILPSIQLWGKYYQPECGNMPLWYSPFNLSVGVGLAWTYFAVLLAHLKQQVVHLPETTR